MHGSHRTHAAAADGSSAWMLAFLTFFLVVSGFLYWNFQRIL